MSDMFWKIYLLTAICVCATACNGMGTTPQNAAFPPTPPSLLTVAKQPWQTPITTQLPPTEPLQRDATPAPTRDTPCTVDDVLSTSPHLRLHRALRNSAYTKTITSIDAFLIFYSDEHLSEEPSAADRRLEYFSGWDGPGMAAVLADSTSAAAWVPADEARRARAALSCSWTVMNEDDFSQPNVAEWIAGKLGRYGRVGADARLISLTEWGQLSLTLQREGLQLIYMPALLDQLWDEEPEQNRRRPEVSRIEASLHESEFTGLSWRNKVNMVRSELRQSGVDAMVVTALDEVAWLLNVRGRDLPYAPLLKAFVFVNTDNLTLYVPPGKLSVAVQEALKVQDCFTSANTTSNNCVRIKDYASIYADLRRASEGKILIPTRGTFQGGASAAIAHSIPSAKRVYQQSPIIYLKAQKNAAEVKGMRVAHLRDAVAMSTLLSYLEGMVKAGLNEMSVAMKVDVNRATQVNFVGHSMRTRVAFGPSGADADYRATAHSNRQVYRNSTLIIQSGGQYVEGTTVVTRTLHYGAPSREERRAYTSVLRALAALATLQLPAALPAAHADLAARAPLWAARQDYTHPTGHGVGAALNRREDLVIIDYRQNSNLNSLMERYFITSEPAWYEPGMFGVRLGNVLEVFSKSSGYLNFGEVTLVPFEPKLIEESMLTEYEITWLNAYNRRIRDTVGPELKEQGLEFVYRWMMTKTEPLGLPPERGARREPQPAKCPETKGTGVREGLYRLSFINSTAGFLQYVQNN